MSFVLSEDFAGYFNMPNRITAAQVWLSPFFHWKKSCELFAKANARYDDTCLPAGRVALQLAKYFLKAKYR